MTESELDKILREVHSRTAADIKRIEEAEKKKFHNEMNRRQFDM